jgi:hypothetical protein
LAVHQARLTGHFYLPTYAMSVVGPAPTWEQLRSGLSYYLGKGEGAGFNWALVTLALAIPAGLALGAFDRRKLAPIGLGALLAWAIPTAYFLPYQIQEPYYLAAGTLAAIAYFAAGACALERRASEAPGRLFGPRLAWIFLAAWPAVLVVPHALRAATLPRERHAAAVAITVPGELRDPSAWIWADYYSGTITYFGGHAAFKLPFSTQDARVRAFALARASGGPQYLVEDSAAMPALMQELRRDGAELELRGKIEPYRYYLVRWPATMRRLSSQRPSRGSRAAPG